MLASFALASLILQPAMQSPLLRNLISNPTGKNGYEEYVQAAIILDKPENRALESYVQSISTVANLFSSAVPRPASIPEGTPMLDLYRRELRSLSAVLDLIRAGSQKPIFYPGRSISALTLFPELSLFKVAERLFQREAYVRFAEGNSAAGTQTILDGLDFARNIEVGGTLHVFVGQACEQIMLATVKQHLDQLSIGDCNRLLAWAEGPGQDRGVFARSLDVERRSIRATYDEFFANPKDYLDVTESPQEERSKLAADIKTVPASVRDELYGFVFKRLEAPWQAVEDVLKRPESDWLQPLQVNDDAEYTAPPQSNPTGAVAVIVLLRLFHVLGMDEVFVSDMPAHLSRFRMQIRLLSIYTAVRRYRWLNNKLPSVLADVFGKEPIDPATLQPYVYEQREGGAFRVYLQTSVLGDVDLVYKASKARDSEPPPP